MLNHPVSGFHYLIEGFKLIFKSGIKRFVIIPLLINALLFVGLFFAARHFFVHFTVWIEGMLPTWLQWLGQVLWVIFFIGFFLIFIYTFVTLANIVAAPFNSFLSEKVETYLTGKTLKSKSLWELIKDGPRVIGRQLGIIGFYIPRAIGLLLLFFVPIVQIIAPVLWFLFNAWFMTLQYLDYPTDNHQIPLNHVKAWLWQKRLLTLSFGSGVLIISMIPILNFIILPAAVAGATQLWVEESQGK